MKINFEPQICKGEEAKWSGHLEIQVPKAVERHNYIRMSGVLAVAEKSNGPKGEGETVKFDLAENYEMMVKLMGFVEKHIVGVKLVRKEDGLKVEKLDDLLCISSLEPAIMELCMLFISGFEPGKNSEA
jgi:hypothetical protein